MRSLIIHFNNLKTKSKNANSKSAIKKHPSLDGLILDNRFPKQPI
ncbi:hypothetical protein PP707_02425 [Acetobacter pasteurianus]|nr:hypothetical protein [Acetobacter pasteurianus]